MKIRTLYAVILISVLLGSGGSLLYAYHSALMLNEPDSQNGMIYQFPTKGGFKFATDLTINELSLNLSAFLISMALALPVLAKSAAISNEAHAVLCRPMGIALVIVGSILGVVLFYLATVSIAQYLASFHVVLTPWTG